MGRFINGLLLGVGVGLLVAPEKGEDIRQNLTDATKGWRDQLNRLLGRGGARLDDLRTFLEAEVEGMTDDAKGKISKILDELGPDERQQGGARGGGQEERAGATQGQRQPASASRNQAAGQRQEASAGQQQPDRQDARAGQQQEGQQEGRKGQQQERQA